MRLRVLTVAGALVLTGMMARPAQAAPIYGASVFATGGHVIATFESNDAGYTNDLYLDSPANALGLIFRNHTTVPGTTMDLGNFAAGTELIFKLHVTNTGDYFFTGAGGRNADGVTHAFADDSVPGHPGRTYVGFEDIYGGGDLDYNDLVFSFTNVRSVDQHDLPVPEPAELMLLGTGLALIAARMRRRFAAKG
jgi:hypothetical protein